MAKNWWEGSKNAGDGVEAPILDQGSGDSDLGQDGRLRSCSKQVQDTLLSYNQQDFLMDWHGN